MVTKEAKNKKPKLKVCLKCGRDEKVVKFHETKNVCNQCRSQKNKEYANTAQSLYNSWMPFMKKKLTSYRKGADTCAKCDRNECTICVFFFLKRKYIQHDSAEAKKFITAFFDKYLQIIKGEVKAVDL